MKKIFKALRFTSLILFVIVSFIACDKDFSSIESDVLGEDNANFKTSTEDFQIVGYNKKLDSLQINNLPSNVLGVFNDPAYGLTTASIITQVTPTSFSPDFGNNPEIDEVILTIPYYSRVTKTETNGDKEYTLDSLYGNDPIKLSAYQNNYFLRDFNPSELDERQNYYSKSDGTDNLALTDDNTINFDNQKGPAINNELDQPLFNEFIPSNKEITIVTGTGDSEKTEKLTPALRVKLNSDFWKTTIIDKNGDPVLSNANNFKNYFRGLYFKAEAIDGKGNMVLLNFASANITIYYKKDSTVEGADKISGTYILNFTGNRLNTFINNYSAVTLENGNKTTGDKKLYLKGAAGSMAVVDLFAGPDTNGDGISDALENFKNTYRKKDKDGNPLPKVNGNYPLEKLINQAHLVIYEDENMPTPSEDYHKYDRIYAYDIKNNIPTIDYSIDPTENTTNPFNSKIINLGQRQLITDASGNSVVKYKIRITEHLNNILIRDSTNTKLGLVLSNNVNTTINAKILKSKDVVTGVPFNTVLTTRGTILHGTLSDDINKRMKLEVFVTEPE